MLNIFQRKVFSEGRTFYKYISIVWIRRFHKLWMFFGRLDTYFMPLGSPIRLTLYVVLWNLCHILQFRRIVAKSVTFWDKSVAIAFYWVRNFCKVFLVQFGLPWLRSCSSNILNLNFRSFIVIWIFWWCFWSLYLRKRHNWSQTWRWNRCRWQTRDKRIAWLNPRPYFLFLDIRSHKVSEIDILLLGYFITIYNLRTIKRLTIHVFALFLKHPFTLLFLHVVINRQLFCCPLIVIRHFLPTLVQLIWRLWISWYSGERIKFIQGLGHLFMK